MSKAASVISPSQAVLNRLQVLEDRQTYLQHRVELLTAALANKLDVPTPVDSVGDADGGVDR